MYIYIYKISSLTLKTIEEYVRDVVELRMGGSEHFHLSKTAFRSKQKKKGNTLSKSADKKDWISLCKIKNENFITIQL